MDQVGAMYKISEILSQAFKQVNDVCAHYLADQTVSNGSKQQKPVEKKQLTEKPHEKSESQPKKQQKVEVSQQKPKSPVVHENLKPTQQSKPKQVQKQQSQSKHEKKPAPHPDKPKQPLSAFFVFHQQQKENVQKIHPKASITELTSMMGEIWRGLDASEKTPYREKADLLKAHYNKKMEKFFAKHPEQKTKKQLKKEKQQSKNQVQNQSSSSPVQKPQSAPASKPSKKSVIVVEQENSDSSD